MVQNLWWTTGYNVVAIPLAAGVLAAKGVLLSPAVGAVFMSLSTAGSPGGKQTRYSAKAGEAEKRT
jgi:hypothetical protein